MPATTPFARRLERSLDANIKALLSVPVGDAHRLAFVQGERKGLETARMLYEQSLRIDDDEAA